MWFQVKDKEIVSETRHGEQILISSKPACFEVLDDEPIVGTLLTPDREGSFRRNLVFLMIFYTVIRNILKTPYIQV